MKSIFFVLLAVVFLGVGCKTVKPVAQARPAVTTGPEVTRNVSDTTTDFSDPATFILGYFKIDRLSQPPYSEWYLRGYDEYSINSEPLNKLMDINTDNLSIKIIMGTWCSDSRREVPKFIKILDIRRFPLSQVTFIGVDKSKKAQVSELDSLKIQKVPTFIIFKNNIEAGRIIENPVTSLEQDMVNILTRNE